MSVGNTRKRTRLPRKAQKAPPQVQMPDDQFFGELFLSLNTMKLLQSICHHMWPCTKVTI